MKRERVIGRHRLESVMAFAPIRSRGGSVANFEYLGEPFCAQRFGNLHQGSET